MNFRNLLSIKNILIAIVVLVVVVVVGYYTIEALTPKENESQKLERSVSLEEKKTMEKNVFTKETLKQYDGKDGRKAYVAINNIVYDVTEKWKNGEHHGAKAGNDVTGFFLKSPHGHKKLEKMKIVGSYQP